MHRHHPPQSRRPDPFDVILRWYATAQVSVFLRPGQQARARHRRGRGRGRDEGIVSVESIGWIGIAIAVVAVVGLIVRTKLTAMANSLPDTLGW
jgi:hypothetical protein